MLGKQLPYVVIAMISFAFLMLVAHPIFHVTIRGSGLALLVGTLLYVLATTGFGALVSTFTETQAAATFAAAISRSYRRSISRAFLFRCPHFRAVVN